MHHDGGPEGIFTLQISRLAADLNPRPLGFYALRLKSQVLSQLELRAHGSWQIPETDMMNLLSGLAPRPEFSRRCEATPSSRIRVTAYLQSFPLNDARFMEGGPLWVTGERAEGGIGTEPNAQLSHMHSRS